MRIHKNSIVNTLLASIMMMAILFCWSSQAQATEVDAFETYYYSSPPDDYYQITMDAVNKIAAEANKYKTDREKLTYINDYLVDNVEYAKIIYPGFGTDERDAYNAFVLGKANCRGYSQSVKLICEALNIPVLFYSGCIGENSFTSMHAWNIVYVDGQWLHLDTTWNDTTGGRYRYFLVTDDVIAEDHGKLDKIYMKNLIADRYPYLVDNGASDVFNPPPALTPITVNINGTQLVSDQPPLIINNRTLVPLRTIFEALGAQVNWAGGTQTVTATRGTTTIIAKIGSIQAKVNGTEKTLDVPAQIINSRTFVPVRFISESLGAKVDWDGTTKTVTIIE